jgi:hypothetical protein
MQGLGYELKSVDLEQKDSDEARNDYYYEDEQHKKDIVLITGDNLDIFFTKVYTYYTNKGIGCLVASKISTLM